MRFFAAILLALATVALADKNTKLTTGQACSADGSLGYCESGTCQQAPGTCV
ncbi:hypothetical protein BDW74DRAFT_179111 [Aspergillus multicolor]|uniref:uncharacterized protein n=1 Tax=Aspergillus multicolor TaxID=41759 RepID=UPI003CCC9A6A